MKIIDTLRAGLKTLEQDLLGSIGPAETAALNAVKNLNISDALFTAASNAVKDVESAITGPGTSSTKFTTAVEAVGKDFGSVATSAIETAVQIAWAALFGASASAAAAPAPATAPAAVPAAAPAAAAA